MNARQLCHATRWSVLRWTLVAAALSASALAHPQQIARDAASAQIAAPSLAAVERYRPDEIDTNSRQQGAREVSAPVGGGRLDDLAATARAVLPSEFEAYVSQIVDKPLRRFGANLLVPAARDFTAPPTTTVPPDYRLNPGDELLVGLTGTVQASNLRLVIDSEGRVFVPRVGAINVAGVRYGDVQAQIAQQVARQYRDFRIAVSIARLHGVTIYVTGFASTPGSYTISSLSTLVNAVLAAGGPSAGGSFRSIQVRRNGQLVSDFDLYDLLLKGDKSADIVLQNGDVIYIAPVGAQVAVIGSVNTEAIYEARADDTLNDVLLYAGGINTVADNSRLLVFDPLRVGGWQQLTPAEAQGRIAARGEIVRVLSDIGVAQPLAQQPALVTISGEVAKPGRYYVQPGTLLTDVVAKAGGLTDQAFPFGAVFARESVRRQQQLSYERALRDIRLSLTAQPLVSALRSYASDAGRLQAVQSVVAQLEARKPEGRLVLDITYTAATLPGALVVENNDTVYVPPRPVTVGVFGSVPNPATFQYMPNMRIGDFVERAGGVQKIGDRSQIFVVRANGMLLSSRRSAFKSGVLKQPALPGDLIFVPIAANRGEFWAVLRDLAAVAFQGGLTAATVVAATR